MKKLNCVSKGKNYILHYFPARGRGEAIRYCFTQAGVKFEDHRIEMSDWANWKSKMPNGSVPVLEIDSKMLPQSGSIIRYLAAEFGLAGKNNWEKAQVDMHIENVSDMISAFLPVVMAIIAGDKSTKEKELRKYQADAFPKFAENYEAHCASKSGYLVGDHVTAADLCVAELLDRYHNSLIPGILNDRPNMKAFMERIHALPNIKKYVETRAELPM